MVYANLLFSSIFQSHYVKKQTLPQPGIIQTWQLKLAYFVKISVHHVLLLVKESVSVSTDRCQRRFQISVDTDRGIEITEETISRAYLEGPPEPTPRTQLNLTFFHNQDMLKTIFDVNKVKNWPFDLERSSKVKVTKMLQLFLN